MNVHVVRNQPANDSWWRLIDESFAHTWELPEPWLSREGARECRRVLGITLEGEET